MDYEADVENNEPNVYNLVEESKKEYDVKMNTENQIAPTVMRVHKLKERIRPGNFEDRNKFKPMNLSHSLEMA